MSSSSDSKSRWFAIGAAVVAAFLLAMFLFIAGAVVWTANEPPRLADPAPTAGPALLCPGQSAPSEAPTDGTPTDGTPTDGAPTDQGVSSTAHPADPDATAQPAGTTGRVTCDPDEVAYAPQHRDSYDVNARLMTLVAVVAPLVTTIVAFYFGQRAGASAGEAEKQKLVAEAAGIRTKEEFEAFQAQLTRGGKMGAGS